MRKYIVMLGKKIMCLFTKISPTLSCKVLFFMRIKKIPNLKQPETFNEKTTWLKLYKYADNELVSKCADKYEVRAYIKEKGYESILNNLYGVYDNFDEIDFSKLPDKFALKCTHGCAYNIICKDKNKFDINDARKKVNRWMKEKYGYATVELHYTKIKPKIIVEKYLCDENGNMPIDYKFYCMNGEVKGVLVYTDRKGAHVVKQNFYSLDWKELFYMKDNIRNVEKSEKPRNFDKMIKCAETLSKDFPFVRVDLYNDNGKIIFGELTFTPGCCCNRNYSEKGEKELGDMLKI